MVKKTPNRYFGEGANGGCFFEIEELDEATHATLVVGYSCVIVHRDKIPITWLAELVAIATEHKDGIAGFLRQHQGVDSYALMCDPPRVK